MRLAFLLAAAAVTVAAPVVASAQTVVPTDKFSSVDLHGGGTITIRQGPVQRVTLISGDPKVARFEVVDRDHDGRLIMSPCDGFCWGSHHFEVEIETPVLNGVGIHGGGHITAHGAFPAQGAVSATIHGGGDIDMKDVPAQAATAEIHGGGKIQVAAQSTLSAEIYGGGAIRYLGQPTVNSSIHGGGGVSPIR
ncbi:MAG: GIN domain-containing protein [Phenylobacterium sp.]